MEVIILDIDVNQVIDELSLKIAKLEKENAILRVRNKQLNERLSSEKESGEE
jgi:regulator of replication initiation timing